VPGAVLAGATTPLPNWLDVGDVSALLELEVAVDDDPSTAAAWFAAGGW
jgi:hypothetical protein